MDKPTSTTPVTERSISIYDYEKPREWQKTATLASQRSAQVYAVPQTASVQSFPSPIASAQPQSLKLEANVPSPPIVVEPKVIQTRTVQPNAVFTQTVNTPPKKKISTLASTPAKPSIKTTPRNADMQKLREQYNAGDINAAHQLARLLINVGQSEEADLILDYASRNGHKASMLLYGNRIKAMGDIDRGEYWISQSEK